VELEVVFEYWLKLIKTEMYNEQRNLGMYTALISPGRSRT